MRASRAVRAYGPYFKTPLRPGGRSHRRSASCLSHRAGKRIDGRRHSHQEPTIVKREYEPREPGIEACMELDVGQDGRAEVKNGPAADRR